MRSIWRLGRYAWCILLVFTASIAPLIARADPTKLKAVAASYGSGGLPINGLGISSLISAPMINDWGEVSFRAERFDLVNFHHGFGAWSISPAGSIREIAHEGMAVPGISADVLDGIAYITNQSPGQAAFNGWIAGENDYVPPLTTGIWAKNEFGEIRMVAKSGEPAPGTNKVFGTFYNSSSFNELSYKLSQQGRVALISSVFDPTGSELYRTGVWREDAAGQLQLLAIENAPVPGSADGTVLRLLKNYAPQLTDQGRVAFLAYSSGPQEDDPWRIGVWREQADNSFKVVADATEPVPGWSSTLYIKNINSFTINNRGDTAFLAVARPTPEPFESDWVQGVWLTTDQGEKRLIVQEEMPVPGLPSTVFSKLDAWSQVLLNGRGEVAFLGSLAGPGVDTSNDTGLWLYRVDGQLNLVAREGDLAPNGNPFTNFSFLDTSFSLNELGQIVFLQGSRDAIWAYDQHDTLASIAESGQTIDVDNGPAVDLRTFGKFNMLTGSSGEDGGRSGFNDRGQIVFHAGLGPSKAGIFLSNAIAVPESTTFILTAAFALCGVGCRQLQWPKAVATSRSLPCRARLP